MHRSWAVINRGALRRNACEIRRRIAPGVKLCAVIKADGYGFGIEEVAAVLHPLVDYFGVANLREGAAIRSQGIATPIMVLSPVLPEERATLVDFGFIPVVSTYEEAARLSEIGRPLECHFVIDTGMGRLGLWPDEASAIWQKIRVLPHLRFAALASHLPVSDEDSEYTSEQLRRFAEIRTRFGSLPATLLNSAGVIHFDRQARPGDIVRTGLPLFGVAPVPAVQPCFEPVLTWKTRVSLLRDFGPGRSISYGRTFITDRETRVATLAVGYGDGYQRHLGNAGTEVLVGGQRCPLLGRVTMDQIMVDVSQVDQVAVGDEVVLIGRQGDEEITATELAARAGTIAWEIFTGLTPRTARVYVDLA